MVNFSPLAVTTTELGLSKELSLSRVVGTPGNDGARGRLGDKHKSNLHGTVTNNEQHSPISCLGKWQLFQNYD